MLGATHLWRSYPRGDINPGTTDPVAKELQAHMEGCDLVSYQETVKKNSIPNYAAGLSTKSVLVSGGAYASDHNWPLVDSEKGRLEDVRGDPLVDLQARKLAEDRADAVDEVVRSRSPSPSSKAKSGGGSGLLGALQKSSMSMRGDTARTIQFSQTYAEGFGAASSIKARQHDRHGAGKRSNRTVGGQHVLNAAASAHQQRKQALPAPAERIRRDPRATVRTSARYSIGRAERFKPLVVPSIAERHARRLSSDIGLPVAPETDPDYTPGPGAYEGELFSECPGFPKVCLDPQAAFSPGSVDGNGQNANAETIVLGANHKYPFKGLLCGEASTAKSTMPTVPQYSFPKQRRCVNDTAAGRAGGGNGGRASTTAVKTDAGCLSPGPIYETFSVFYPTSEREKGVGDFFAHERPPPFHPLGEERNAKRGNKRGVPLPYGVLASDGDNGGFVAAPGRGKHTVQARTFARPARNQTVHLLHEKAEREKPELASGI